MDLQNLNHHLDFFATCGKVFSTEQRVLLLNSLTCAKKNYKYKSMQYWGKILTLKDDYHIVIGTKECGDLQTLYSLNGFDWSILEDPTEEEMEMSRTIRGRFTGDPSFRYTPIKEQAPGHQAQDKGDDASRRDTEKAIIDDSIKEEVRLSVTVKDITNEAMIIPKGASSDYSKSNHFSGFSPHDSKNLKNWCGQGAMHEKYWSVQSHVNRL